MKHVKLGKKKKVAKCRIHSLPLKYQCEDCQKPICSDCGIIGNEHKGHKIVAKN